MQAKTFPQIYAVGDSAISICFGNHIDESTNLHVHALHQQLQMQAIDGILDFIPAYSSLTVVYDVFKISKHAENMDAHGYMQELLLQANASLAKSDQSTERKLQIPVCYVETFGVDLATMASANQMTIQQIVDLHCAKIYRVYMLGFLPGFAYMGKVDERIVTPRKSTPRKKTDAGSVGIAGLQTGIYPLDSPGGWKIIGRTPLQLFDATKENPCLLQPNDAVQFTPINIDEFYKIQSAQ
jgi:inhibitor of KinA